jgi:hypothetical protein
MEAPESVTREEASRLTGHSLDVIARIMDEDGVELVGHGDEFLIEKRSLYEFQECLAMVLNWDDWSSTEIGNQTIATRQCGGSLRCSLTGTPPLHGGPTDERVRFFGRLDNRRRDSVPPNSLAKVLATARRGRAVWD